MDIQHERMTGSKRLTLGFISENSQYDSESRIFRGVLEAAERHDANVICFSPFIDDKELLASLNRDQQDDSPIKRKLDQLKRHLDAFNLDGIIIFGWSREYDEHYLPYFRDLIAPVKIMSIGKPHSAFGIPSVISVGGIYVAELARHLIEVHQRRRIGFISAWHGDARLDAYMETTQELGCYDEQLVIRPEDLEAITDVYERIERAIAILLDERKLRIDALMTMNTTEANLALQALRRRGLRVPEDIALTSYEDNPSIAYAKPSLTTIEYPYHNLGYAACDNLARWLNGESIDDIQEIPASLFYRDSCGCTVNGITPPVITYPNAYALQERSIEQIASELRDRYPFEGFDYAELAGFALDGAFKDRDSSFSSRLWQLTSTLKPNTHTRLNPMLERFRELMLPLYASDADAYRRAEEMWFSARFIVRDYESTSLITAYIDEHDTRSILNHIHQNLLLTQSLSDVLAVLNNNLGWIQIPTAFLLLDDGMSTDVRLKPIFAFTDYYNIVDDLAEYTDIGEIYRRFQAQKNGRFAIMVMPLSVDQTRVGLGWFDANRHNMNVIYSLGVQIGKSLRSNLILEESQLLVRRLSHEIELRREKEAQLAYYAEIDSLTRLFNRRYFYHALERIAADNDAFTVFYIDIDGFKQVNDTMGHHVGDELLEQIAHRLRNVLEGEVFPLVHASLHAGTTESGSIFRLGGDEFTALLPLSDRDAAAMRARRIAESLSAPFKLSAGEAYISASIGIGIYPDDAADEEQLLHLADRALYEAKKAKNTYIFYRDMK